MVIEPKEDPIGIQISLVRESFRFCLSRGPEVRVSPRGITVCAFSDLPSAGRRLPDYSLSLVFQSPDI